MYVEIDHMGIDICHVGMLVLIDKDLIINKNNLIAMKIDLHLFNKFNQFPLVLLKLFSFHL